jgi:hypothetical protein
VRREGEYDGPTGGRMTNAIKVGDIVRSTKSPQWGRGKVVACEAGKVFVVFENVSGDIAKRLDPVLSGLEVLRAETVPMLDYLPPFKRRASDYVLEQRRLSLQDLVSHFIRLFPARFDDTAYVGTSGSNATGERAYKLVAHQAFVEAFAGGRGERMIEAQDGRAIAVGIRSVLMKENLLAKQERIAFLDALEDDGAAVRYLAALVEYLRGAPTKATFEAYATAVDALPRKGQFRVATWPVATLLPFLSLRWNNMFLKPEVTKQAAAIMGVDLRYESELNWTTYERLLLLADHLMSVLHPVGARDPIDVQSFIWVALKYP